MREISIYVSYGARLSRGDLEIVICEILRFMGRMDRPSLVEMFPGNTDVHVRRAVNSLISRGVVRRCVRLDDARMVEYVWSGVS